jgi:excinuclease UvrABC nuclease subunit
VTDPRCLPFVLYEDAGSALPKACGVYIVMTKMGEVLYVGSSGDMRKRFKCHHQRVPEFSEAGAHSVAYVCTESGVYRKLESSLIDELVPSLGGESGRPQKISKCPYCYEPFPESKWRPHVWKCEKKSGGKTHPQFEADRAALRRLSKLTKRDKETLAEASRRALEECAYAIDRLRGDESADGRREEQQWAKRFRALQRKLKGAR